jgi:hypothetical protein
VINATHNDAAGQHSDERARYISRRPTWADEVRISQEAIDYTWRTPTVPECIEPSGEACPIRVEVTREDMLYVNDTGVVVDPGAERIFLLYAHFDVENARKLAAALTEACDRLDGAR